MTSPRVTPSMSTNTVPYPEMIEALHKILPPVKFWVTNNLPLNLQFSEAFVQLVVVSYLFLRRHRHPQPGTQRVGHPAWMHAAQAGDPYDQESPAMVTALVRAVRPIYENQLDHLFDPHAFAHLIPEAEKYIYRHDDDRWYISLGEHPLHLDFD